MGRNAAVTYEQVCGAAMELRAGGTTPGAKAIRQMLGDIGSLGTIQKFLQRMLAEQAEQPVANRMLPPELQKALFKFADEEVTRINSELAFELSNCKRAVADLAKDNELLGERITQLKSQNEQFTILAAGLDGRVLQLLEEINTARNQAGLQRGEAEIARTELMKAQLKLQTLTSLETDLRHLRADFEEQRKAYVNAERSAAVLAAQKTDLEQRLVELKGASAVGHTARIVLDGICGESSDPNARPTKKSRQTDRKAMSSDSQGATRTADETTTIESKPGETQQQKLF